MFMRECLSPNNHLTTCASPTPAIQKPKPYAYRKNNQHK